MEATNSPELLDALAVKGVLLNVTVRYWRARKKLTPEDLGLTGEQVNERLISLGHKRLLPKESMRQLALLESRTHAFVAENTFPFMNGIARYLPNERLPEVMERLDVLRSEFEQAQSDFINQYADLREKALDEWVATANQLNVNAQQLISVIREAFPTVEVMDRYFLYDANLFQVSVPSLPQKELIEAQTAMEISKARQNACLHAQERIDQSCRNFIQECTQELRKQTGQLCTDVLESINSKNSVHQKTLNRLHRFIDQFKHLNFVNDSEMERQLEKLRSTFLNRTAEEYRQDDTARLNLVEGLEVLRDKAKAMAEEDTSHLINDFGQMGKRSFNLVA
jgi:hypothetical protein